MTEEAMEHGTERNRQTITDYGDAADFRDARTGAVVYNGPLCSHTYTQSERFCKNCGWVTCKGIVAHIACLGCSEMW